MSAYSIVNLKEEVEDSMGERAPGIEGRFARKHLDSEHLGISYLRYSPGVRSPSAHSHREQEEAYVVISGSGQVRLDGGIRELRCWDVVRVNPATVRAFEAKSNRKVCMQNYDIRYDDKYGQLAQIDVAAEGAGEPKSARSSTRTISPCIADGRRRFDQGETRPAW